MYLETYDRFGGTPLRLPVAQVVVYADNGTPLAVVAEYGPAGSYLVEHASDAPQEHQQFLRSLRALGIHRTVLVEPFSAQALKNHEPAR